MLAAEDGERRLDFRLQFLQHVGVKSFDLHGRFLDNKRAPPRTGTINPLRSGAISQQGS
jgi:hypothetical protein